MEKIKHYQQIITDLLREYAAPDSSVPAGVEDQVICDYQNNHYQLVTTGWDKDRFIYITLFHFDIKPNGKIWLMANNTDVRIAEELVRRGVPRTDIVLGFQPSYTRPFTDYAAA